MNLHNKTGHGRLATKPETQGYTENVVHKEVCLCVYPMVVKPRKIMAAVEGLVAALLCAYFYFRNLNSRS